MAATILNDEARKHLPGGALVIDEIHSTSHYSQGAVRGHPRVDDRLTRVDVDFTYTDPADGSVWFAGAVASLDYAPIYINGFRLAIMGQRGLPGSSFPKPQEREVEVHCLDGPAESPEKPEKNTGLTYPAPDSEHPAEAAQATEPARREKRPNPTKVDFRAAVPERTEDPLRLPEDSATRKEYPIVTGVLDYFPDAIAELARLAKFGNDKHNPGEDLHWSREKSSDHIDCIGRHLLDRGRKDGDFYHDVMIAWRALANLQLLMEQEKGLPPSRGSR